MSCCWSAGPVHFDMMLIWLAHRSKCWTAESGFWWQSADQRSAAASPHTLVLMLAEGGYTAIAAYLAGTSEVPSSSFLNAQISALPLLDPLVPGRMESLPNRLAFVPQFGTSLSSSMVSPACLHARALLHVQ